MPKIHPLASVYVYERMNEDGLVAVANSPYPLIPKVYPMKRAPDVHQALSGDFDDAYVFAVARSYIAEKFLKRKFPAAVHASVLAVERKIDPYYLQAFHDARVYFGLPRSFLYRDMMSPTPMVAGVPVNRLSFDDPDGPPAYTREPPTVQTVTTVARGVHCATCTCAAHEAQDSPPYGADSPSSLSNSPSPNASSTSLFRPRASLGPMGPLGPLRRQSMPLPPRGRSFSDGRAIGDARVFIPHERGPPRPVLEPRSPTLPIVRPTRMRV